MRSTTENGQALPEGKRNVLVILDACLAVRPVEDYRCRVDSNSNALQPLGSKPKRGRAANARELAGRDRFGWIDGVRAFARTYLAYDEERAAAGDDVELEVSDANVPTLNGEAAFLE